ncbi:MAG TPA: sigma-70 family RNA polymerase sigma factor, partial [Myxococcota bacterium]
LLALAYRLTSSHNDAEDVVQEAFVSTLRHHDQFLGAAQPSTWLYRVTFNAALMRLRSGRRKKADSLDALPGTIADRVVGEARANSVFAADDVVADHERADALDEAMTVLCELDQQLMRLRYDDDLSTDEVAARTGLTTSAVKTRLHRARARLKDVVVADARCT